MYLYLVACIHEQTYMFVSICAWLFVEVLVCLSSEVSELIVDVGL